MFGLGDLSSFGGPGGGQGPPPPGQGRGQPMVKTKPCFAFQRGECSRGESCFYIHDMSASAVGAGGGGGGGFSPQGQCPPVKKPCFNFMRGACQQGDSCPYSHDAADLQKSDKLCTAFQSGTCKFGDMCRFKHEKDPAFSGGAAPLKKGICNSFSRTGTCQYGDRCYYNHIAPGASGPPGMPGMFGMMGMQGMPGQAAAPMGMAAGPFRPIFFAGHIGKSEGEQEGAEDEGEEEEEEEDEDEDEDEEEKDEDDDEDEEEKGDGGDGNGGEKLKADKEKKERDVAYDLYFNKKVYFLEGLHIVPRGITPPGIEIPFEGATTPALDSFNLEVLARNVDTEELVTVLKLNVIGGVQWAPIENPLNTIAVDYLVFRGSFNMISVIIHGGEVEHHMLPQKSQDLVHKGIPVPAGWKDPEDDDTGFEYSSDEDNRGEDDRKKRRQGDRMIKIADPPAKIVHTMDMPVNSMHEALSAYVPEDTKDLLAMFCTKGASKFPDNCIIDVESAAVLVGKVFSLDEGVLTASAATLVETLDDLSMCIDECLMSVISSAALAAIEEASEKAKFAAFKDVFDEEAVSMLISYVVKALDLMRVGGEAIAFDGLSGLAEQASAVEQVADTVLRMCESLLRNELTAASFADAGGLSKLAIISAQKPRLPSKLRVHVLETLCMGVKCSSALASFTEVPLFDLSGYQNLATCMKDTLSSETSAAAAGVEAMNWCQLYEALQRAGTSAEELTDSVSEIAKPITMHLSAMSMSSGEEELAVAAERLPDTAPVLAESVIKLQEVHAEVKKLTVAVDAAMVAVTMTPSCVVGVEEVQLAIVKVLLETRIAGFLTILAGLVGVATDLVAIHEWDVAVDTQHSVGLALSCRSMLVGLVSRILAVGNTEIFFALCPQQMQELWSFLSPEAHLLATQSIDEIDQAASLKMRLSSLGWSLKLMACVGNAVMRQGPYDLYEYFSFPAGAAVASRLGALLVAPELLVKMETLSKMKQPSVSDHRIAEKSFRVLAHLVHSDHSWTVNAMAEHISRLHDLAGRYLKLDDTVDLKKVKTVALRISRATTAISARAAKSGVDSPSAAIEELLQISSIEREALPSLDVCFSVVSVSTDKLRDMAIRPGSSEAFTKLFVLCISAVNKTCSWLRADAALALDASIAISGYEEDLFGGKYDPLPLAADIKGKAERLDTDVAIHRAKLLFRCLLASMSLLGSLVTALTASTALSLQSPELVSAVEIANSTVRQLYGVHKSGFLGLYSRRVAASCLSMFGSFCRLSRVGECEENRLIPYLLSRAIEAPALFQANVELVSELLLSSREVIQTAPLTEYADIEGFMKDDLALPLTASFQYEVLDSEVKLPPSLEASSDSAKARFVNFWEMQLHSQPIMCNGKRLVPFSLKYEAAKQLTGSHVLQQPTVTASERMDALPWTDFATGGLLSDSCDPSLPFVSSFVQRSFTVADILAAATISASIEVNEAACALAVQVMTVSIESAKRVSAVLLDRLRSLVFVNASLSAPLIAAGLKEKERKKSAGEEADEALETLQENSDELCRLLIFIDALCAQPSLCPCMVLVSSGLLQYLFLCLRSCRQEVVALALQALGNTYRQLAYCSSQLNAQASASGHSAVADCAKEVLGSTADTLVELLPDVLKRFQESEQTLVLAQTAILAQMLRLKHQKLFLDAVSKGLTIEFFVIKLWLSLEDSFQALVEITETFKSVDSDGIEDGEERLQSAFCAVAISAMALRCAAELALQAYNRGWISLLTLTRCMRVSLTDPRKVSMQFQRAYTMWWTNDRLQVEKARLAAHFRDSTSSREKSKRSRDTVAAADHDVEASSSHGQPPILQPRGLFFAEDTSLGGNTAARNAMINTSLRRVVETAAKVMEYNKAGDRVERMPCNDVFSSTRSSSVEMAGPFVTASVESILAGTSSVQQTLSIVDDMGGDNAFHTALRRVIVAGYEKRSSIFDCPQRYIRLRAAPRSVDPEAADRRRGRRKKRKLDDISERKRRLEVAAHEKAEIESRRRAIEDQRGMIGDDNPQVVQLSGVPRQNVGDNFTVRPIMDFGNQ